MSPPRDWPPPKLPLASADGRHPPPPCQCDLSWTRCQCGYRWLWMVPAQCSLLLTVRTAAVGGPRSLSAARHSPTQPPPPTLPAAAVEGSCSPPWCPPSRGRHLSFMLSGADVAAAELGIFLSVICWFTKCALVQLPQPGQQ